MMPLAIFLRKMYFLWYRASDSSSELLLHPLSSLPLPEHSEALHRGREVPGWVQIAKQTHANPTWSHTDLCKCIVVRNIAHAGVTMCLIILHGNTMRTNLFFLL